MSLSEAIPAPPLSGEQIQTLQQLTAGASDAALWWIAGYAAGQAAARGATPAPKPQLVSAQRLTVLYGSQTGNAKAAAGALVQQAEAQGVAARLVNIAEYSLAELARERFLAVAISTQGDGDPTDDARLFFKQLSGARAPKLPELRYTVLALGDSSYAKFCEIGRRLDERLAELGAQRLAARADADLDIEATAAPWRKQALLAAAEALGRHAPANVTLLRAVPAQAPVARVLKATLLANQRLTACDSEVDVRHLELSAPGLRYEPGDALEVRVANPSALVEEFLARTRLDGETSVEHSGERASLRDWLTRRRELTRLSPALLDALFADHPGHALHEIGPALIDTHQVVDVLVAGGIGWDPARWVTMLLPLKPRAYSIASAQASAGDEVHLTVAVKRSQGAGIERAGLASGHLAMLAEGAEIEVELAPNPRFRLPRDGSRDVIMIGPGTGVAPFRGFLQQRVAEGASGRNWLVFGHRHLQREFLYQTEWLQAFKRGQLRRLSVAWSRDGGQRRYVQHLLAEQAREVVAWIDAGAHLYVCGDAKRMARDVERALIEAISGVRGIDADAAGEELDALAAGGRYQRDVY